MNAMMYAGLAGAFGGIFPNLFSLGAKLLGGGELPHVSYLLGMLIFALLGAGVVVFHKETIPQKAFLLGLSLPSFFQVGMNNVTRTPSPESVLGLFSVSSLYAQDVQRDESEKEDGIKIKIKIENVQSNQDIKIVVTSSQNGTEKKVVYKVTDAKSYDIKVPVKTEFVEITGEDVAPLKLNIKDYKKKQLKLKLKENMWSGLLEAMGVANVKKYEVQEENKPGGE